MGLRQTSSGTVLYEDRMGLSEYAVSSSRARSSETATIESVVGPSGALACIRTASRCHICALHARSTLLQSRDLSVGSMYAKHLSNRCFARRPVYVTYSEDCASPLVLVAKLSFSSKNTSKHTGTFVQKRKEMYTIAQIEGGKKRVSKKC